MKSLTRQSCERAVIQFSEIINEKAKAGKLLYVGIAGDIKGGEYSYLFPAFATKTFDFDAKWEPDIVGDITRTEFDSNSWDVVVCTQTMEHIPNVQDLPKELHRILRHGGYAIVDCPWNYPYHAEPPSFGDYWRISKDGMKVLFADFKIVAIVDNEHNTSCLIQKP